MSLLIPQISVTPAQALRAIASKMDRGEIRTFYLAVVDDKGKPNNHIYINPRTGDQDVQVMGNTLCDAVERLAAHVDAGARMSTAGARN